MNLTCIDYGFFKNNKMIIVELVTSKGKVQRLKEIRCCKYARKHRGVQCSQKNMTLRGVVKK